jgi:hypothetical protein
MLMSRDHNSGQSHYIVAILLNIDGVWIGNRIY